MEHRVYILGYYTLLDLYR